MSTRANGNADGVNFPVFRVTADTLEDVIASTIRRFFEEHDLEPNVRAAVSGGVDSTALLLALADLRPEGFAVVAGHVNHHLRGAESDDDEQFVRSLCASLDVELLRADGTLDEETIRRSGIEAAARDVRFQILQDMRHESGARWIATAHHRDDQAETILMRLLTGTGIAGLRGIHPIRDDGVIRPLLELSRVDLEAFLSSRGITPRHDSSNIDSRFLRNRLRRLLIEIPESARHLAEIASSAGALWSLAEPLIEAEEKRVVTIADDAATFVQRPENDWLWRTLLLRQIRRLDPSSRDVTHEDLARLTRDIATRSRITVTRTLELTRLDDRLVLQHINTQDKTPSFEFSLRPGQSVAIPHTARRISLRRVETTAPPPVGAQRFQLPEGAETEFTVRNRRAGDRMQPLGLPYKKKLKDLLIDRKIAARLRDQIPLLLWNDEIVWAAGVTVSEAFKVTDPPGVLYEVWTESDGAPEEDQDQAKIHRQTDRQPGGKTRQDDSEGSG